MKCPECGGLAKVFDSRPNRQTVYRRRHCLSETCGHRWSTWEMTEEDYNKLQTISARVGQLKSLLDVEMPDLTTIRAKD